MKHSGRPQKGDYSQSVEEISVTLRSYRCKDQGGKDILLAEENFTWGEKAEEKNMQIKVRRIRTVRKF